MVVRSCVAASLIALTSASFAASLSAQRAAAPTTAPQAGIAATRLMPQATGKIRGIVFDSLLMKPVAGASVTVLSSNRTLVSDANGNFAFDSVAVGSQTISMTAPEIDSLGLGTLGATVTVVANQTARITIATPSMRTLWGFRCANVTTIGRDSGVVWGTISDAANGAPLNAATATVGWYGVQLGGVKGIQLGETRLESTTGNSGVYVACGLPVKTPISVSARSAVAASSEVEFTLDARRLHRLDLMVSTDMVAPDSSTLQTARDSMLAQRARGHATIRGVVIDEKHNPMPNAVVMVSVADTTVRTDAAGKFQLAGLPAGTQTIEVRRVGQTPVKQIVQLRGDQPHDVTIEMSSANALATINVRAKGDQLMEYEERRDKGIGYSIDSTILNHRPDFVSALRNTPFVFTTRKGSGIQFDKCLAPFLDGLGTSLALVSVLPPDHFRAVEVIRLPEQVPDKYKSDGCGVILFWSVNARWEK